MLSSFFMSLYFSSLLSFSLVSHPIFYCIMLLLNLCSVCAVTYIMFGFSWYVALLCLVYVGGVYVLFIFVSVNAPNTSTGVNVNLFPVFLVFVFFFILSYSFSFISLFLMDESYFLCSMADGSAYCFFCVIMLLSFICVSMVMGYKDSFYR